MKLWISIIVSKIFFNLAVFFLILTDKAIKKSLKSFIYKTIGKLSDKWYFNTYYVDICRLEVNRI